MYYFDGDLIFLGENYKERIKSNGRIIRYNLIININYLLDALNAMIYIGFALKDE